MDNEVRINITDSYTNSDKERHKKKKITVCV